MVKHTQTIRRQFTFVFDHSVDLALKGLRLGEKFMETLAGVYFSFVVS